MHHVVDRPAPIRLLDPTLAARVAAGEVVERPASVVKELLENAIDAGATHICVDIEEGGLRLIRVQDNGRGIPDDEMDLAFARHATSKMFTLDDLSAINTLGFRGEALPSIAAVAEVELASCTEEGQRGGVVHAHGAHVVRASPRGLPRGSTVTVRDLFAAVPARLKFLKSRAGETAAVQSVIVHYALAYPHLRLQLYNDGRLIFSAPGVDKLIDVVSALYGPAVAARMLPFEGEHRDTRVWGLCSPPDVNRPSRTYQSFFVNGRWVRNRMLSVALEDAYHTHLMVGRRPLAVVYLTVQPSLIDVNVHPTKAEVKFLYEREVFSAVRDAVRGAVLTTMSAPGHTLTSVDDAAAQAGDDALLAQGALDLGLADAAGGAGEIMAGATRSNGDDALAGPAPRARADMLPVLRVLGQVNNLYIIAEGVEGVYMVDQHAAHERVLFDELTAAATEKTIEAQYLLEPLPIELSLAQYEALETCEDDFRPFGFLVEPFGASAALLRAAPAVLADDDPADVLREMLDGRVLHGDVADWREKALTTLACKSAVKAGQALTMEEMRQLVYRLERTARPRTCPHGRPTIILLSASQLEREFGRRG